MTYSDINNLNINNKVKELLKTYNQKETEHNWQKMNTYFETLLTIQLSKDDLIFITRHVDFVKNCLLSLRSKLTLTTVKSSIYILDSLNSIEIESAAEFTYFYHFYTVIIDSSFKLCNKPSKIISNRGIELLRKCVQLTSFYYSKTNINYILGHQNSLNKNVRFGLYISIADYLEHNKDIENYFGNVLNKGMKDPSLEVRNICKKLNGNKTVNTVNLNKKHTYQQNITESLVNKKFNTEPVKKTPKTNTVDTIRKNYERPVNFPFLRRPVRNSNTQHSDSKQKMFSESLDKEVNVNNTKSKKIEHVKENISQKEMLKKSILNDTVDNVLNSPFKKMGKFSTKPIETDSSSRDIKTPTKSEDELFTPQTLNKFLQKYKNISVKNLEFEDKEELKNEVNQIKIDDQNTKTKVFGDDSINKGDGILEAVDIDDSATKSLGSVIIVTDPTIKNIENSDVNKQENEFISELEQSDKKSLKDSINEGNSQKSSVNENDGVNKNLEETDIKQGYIQNKDEEPKLINDSHNILPKNDNNLVNEESLGNNKEVINHLHNIQQANSIIEQNNNENAKVEANAINNDRSFLEVEAEYYVSFDEKNNAATDMAIEDKLEDEESKNNSEDENDLISAEDDIRNEISNLEFDAEENVKENYETIPNEKMNNINESVKNTNSTENNQNSFINNNDDIIAHDKSIKKANVINTEPAQSMHFETEDILNTKEDIELESGIMNKKTFINDNYLKSNSDVSTDNVEEVKLPAGQQNTDFILMRTPKKTNCHINVDDINKRSINETKDTTAFDKSFRTITFVNDEQLENEKIANKEINELLNAENTMDKTTKPLIDDASEKLNNSLSNLSIEDGLNENIVKKKTDISFFEKFNDKDEKTFQCNSDDFGNAEDGVVFNKKTGNEEN